MYRYCREKSQVNHLWELKGESMKGHPYAVVYHSCSNE